MTEKLGFLRMTIVLRQGEINTFKRDARYVKTELKEQVQLEGRTYQVLTYARRLTPCECVMRGLAWALSCITIIPLLFCRAGVSRLLNEAQTKIVTKKIFVPVDYQAKFDKLKKLILNITKKPIFINSLVKKDFSLENYSKLKTWLKARDILVVWAAIARKAKIAENNLKILEFPNIEAMVEKAEKFGDWCVRNADEIVKLVDFSLQNYQLRNLPKEIGNLSQLQHLDLQGNQLRNLPEEIGNLSRLIYLNLDGNQLKELPKYICNLSQLNRLNLPRNQLKELPEKIGNLSKITYLNLGSNQLEELPKAIGNLSQLKVFYIYNNKLSELPKAIGNFSKLETLYLDDNKLKKLPSEIGKLSLLRYLHLSNNQLKKLPKAIANFSQLAYVNLANNQFIDLDKELRRLELLECRIGR